ncbi:hypothetical protein ACOTD3_10020 [Achromobacter dolens]|uniref:hypothetical protein n=1 Tax=Achromobacter dolens TaxID=1287738 RepID=UPI003BA18FA8
MVSVVSMPSSVRLSVVTASARATRPSSAVQPDTISTMSPSAAPWAAAVTTAWVALVTAVATAAAA